MIPQAALPTEVSTAGDFARHLALLIGPAQMAADGTFVAARMLALGGALAAARAQVLALRAEFFPDTAEQLLSEWETSLGLPERPDLSTADRRTRLVAKWRALRAGTPFQILLAVAKYSSSVSVTEYSAAVAAASGDPLSVYRFTVGIDSGVYAVAASLAAIREIIEQMKPAYTKGTVVPSAGTGLRWDDATTTWDNAVFGV